MTVNHALIGQDEPWRTFGYVAGRPCIAVFASLLMLRLTSAKQGAAARAAGRLLAFGLVAQPAYLALTWNSQLRLDILFTLAAGAALIGLTRARRWKGAALLAVALVPAGAFIEGGFLTPLAMAVGAAAEARRKGGGVAIITATCALAAGLAAPDLPAAWIAVLAAPPLLLASARYAQGLRRSPGWWFYAYYPAHLAAIFLILGAYPGR
jgi:hypothetical protein